MLATLVTLTPFSPALAQSGPSAAAVGPLTLYLHGNDIPGTLDGFTMNGTPAGTALLPINLLNEPHWYSAETLSGRFGLFNQFFVQFPCLLGLSVAPTIRVEKSDASGANRTLIAQRSGLLGLCLLGIARVRIPTVVPLATLTNERLRLSFSAPAAALVNLRLGQSSFFRATVFNTP